VHFSILQIVDHFTDLLADRSPARFAGGENGVALLAQVFDKVRDVRGLAGAFGAFEGDEHGLEIREERIENRSGVESYTRIQLLSNLRSTTL
jgi:hypothetical protein